MKILPGTIYLYQDWYDGLNLELEFCLSSSRYFAGYAICDDPDLCGFALHWVRAVHLEEIIT